MTPPANKKDVTTTIFVVQLINVLCDVDRSPQALPQITLDTDPFKTGNVTMMDTIVLLVTIIVWGIATTAPSGNHKG